MNLLDGFKPLLLLSRAFGMAPYGIGGRTFEKSSSFTLYSFALFVVNLFCQTTFVACILLNGSLGFVQGFIQSLDSMTFALNCLGCSFLMLLRRNVILENIRKLNEFCSTTKFLPKNHLMHLKRISWTLSIFSFFFSTLFSFADAVVQSKNMTQMSQLMKYYLFLCGFIRIIICYLTCCHFVFYFTLVKFMHLSVNWNLMNLRNLHEKKPGPKSKGLVLKGFKFLVATDGWIKDLTEQWFITFSLYGVCICAVVLFEVVYTTVFYYMTSISFVELCASLIWIFYFLSQFFVIVTVSVLSAQEAERTANYLHELFIDSDDVDIKEEIEIFSLQLLHRKVEFNACGFFKLDFSLLYSMVGAVTTYIIILMQFQDNPGTMALCRLNCTNCSDSK